MEACHIQIGFLDPVTDYSRRQSYPGYSQDDEFTNERENGEDVLDSISSDSPADIAVETELDAGDPARTILRYTDENDVSQIVMGSHGREGIARYLFGSVTETVARRSAVRVTVVSPSE